MESSNSQPQRAQLPDVNINTGMQSINTERVSLKTWLFLSDPSRNVMYGVVGLTKPLNNEYQVLPRSSQKLTKILNKILSRTY